jgi:hypothetical protein
MKRWKTAAALAATMALGVLGTAGDARACAVLTPDETTPVTGHQMVLSISAAQTTLWDRFAYAGDPASFAWILPTKGPVDVGLSSDALFDALGQLTAPEIFAPAICPDSCRNDGVDAGAGAGNGGGSQGGVVEVKAEKVVGPYQTVQLSSQDPAALTTWLTDNGYPIPDAVKALLGAYVAEGFDFLAMKLLPDKGLDATRPVRITMPGAAPSVPVRLLAAGTGASTAVTLFVLGDGRYDPTNAPTVTIASSDLTWDAAASKSDYEAVKAAKLAATAGQGYLVEQSRPISPYEIATPLEGLVASAPATSGYGDDQQTPDDALKADLDALDGALGMDLWISRLVADLSHDGMKADLALGAAQAQTVVDGKLYPTKVANAPTCPPDPCAGQGGAGGGAGGGAAAGGAAQGGSGPATGSGGAASTGTSATPAAASDGSSDSGGCAVRAPIDRSAGFALIGLALAALVARRRRG